MVLAAGLGLRLRPITDRIPKPLVEVGGRTLLDHAIDRFEAAGVETVVVNAHYKAEMIEAHLAQRKHPRIVLSKESELLETGGGVVKALPHLGDCFYVANSDVFWLNGKIPALERLARAWNPEKLDALLLLQRTTTATGYEGIGDFILSPDGLIRRRKEREVAPHLYAGVQIMHRRLLEGRKVEKFSLNACWDKAIEAGRISAIVHDGEWFHIGTPEGLEATEERLNTMRTER